MKKIILASLAIFLLAFFSFAKIVRINGEKPGVKSSKKGMYCVYTKNWFFGVPAMPGWDFIEEDGADNLNAYYAYAGKTIDDSAAIMYIKVMDKVGKNMQGVLASDMKDFRGQESSVKFYKYPEGKNKRFITASEIYVYKDRMDFLTFLDPGKKYKFYMLFCLAGPANKTPGFESYFRELISGFVAVGTRDELVLKP